MIKIYTEIKGKKMYVASATDGNITLTADVKLAFKFDTEGPAFSIRKQIISKLGPKRIVLFELSNG